jgi:serine/threonine protein phosphatase PrpC
VNAVKYDLSTTSRLGNRKSNQDRFAVVETPNAVLMVLADGMSGHADGKLAADTVVDSIVQSFNNTTFPHPKPTKFLEQVIAIAQQDILNAGARQNPPSDPRTTCVAAVVQEGQAWCGHVGDSRLYWLRQGRVLSRTLDHSRVEELYQKGLITAEQREKHPQRNIVTQCMGSRSRRPKPRISLPMPMQPDDVLLLCSDGLWGALPQNQLVEYLNEFDVGYALEELAQKAEENTFPKCDNVSAIAFRWQANTPLEPTLTAKKRVEDNSKDLEELTRSLEEITKAVKALDGGR